MTQLNQEQTEKLSDEVEKAASASKFYNQFVQPFVEEKRERIFAAFAESDPTNLEGLAELRRMISIVNIFEYEIRAFIETGHMAQISINEADKH